MKRRNALYLIPIILAIFVVIVLLSQRSQPVAPSKPNNAAPAPTRAEEDTDTASPGLAAAPATKASEAKEEEEKTFKIRANQVVATVNGVAITGKDLAPFNSQNPYAEQSMSAALYQYLLDRAIERELTFQEARVKGVGLAPAQQDQLDEIAKWFKTRDTVTNLATAVGHLNVGGASPDDQAAFDVRDASGFLFQNSLMTAVGAPPPHVTSEQVEAYYKSHADKYGALPDDPDARALAWQKIDVQIRQDIASSTLQAYQERLRQYIEQLKASASITINKPSS